MKRKLRWMILLSVIGVISTLLTLDLLHEYPEKFEITGIEMKLFHVSITHNPNECYILKDIPTISDTDKVVLVGFKFKIKYISLKHEHLYDLTNDEYGAQGPVDSIIALQFISGTNDKVMDSKLFKDASNYKYFKPLKGLLINHHMTSSNCYVAQTYATPEQFIADYN
jgi:hypothetical protein